MMRPRFRTVLFLGYGNSGPEETERAVTIFAYLFFFFCFHAFKCELNLDLQEWVYANTNYRNDSRV